MNKVRGISMQLLLIPQLVGEHLVLKSNGPMRDTSFKGKCTRSKIMYHSVEGFKIAEVFILQA